MPERKGIRQIRDPVAIQAEIERAREEITSSVLVLRERVQAATDWREWVRRRPWPSMGIAVAFGFWLGFGRKEREA